LRRTSVYASLLGISGALHLGIFQQPAIQGFSPCQSLRGLMVREKGITKHCLLSCMELGKALTSELQPERLFSTILQKVSELLPAETWSLLLMDENTGELQFELSVNLDLALLRDLRLKPGEGVAGMAVLKRKALVVKDVKQCDFFYDAVDKRTGCVTRSIVCAPLIFGNKVLGVIEVVNPQFSQGSPLPLLSVIADYAAIAVENMRRYREIQHLAVHDDLTGLYNTRYLYKALSEMIRQSESDGEPFSLIFLDIDNFKQVVDAHGHLKGSQTLQEVAATIREVLPDGSFGVSYGGDEFVTVLRGFDKQAARQKAEEIRSRMRDTVYLAECGHNVDLTASFGIATYPDDGREVTRLLAVADQAMFSVKAEGKDAVKST
jgi:diguanylate cyclase (GGDEF)-like protein